MSDKNWKEEWQGMPEFVQTPVNTKPYAQINIRFKSKEDLDEFCKLINQNLTNKTKGIWIPAIERGLDANKIYVDAE